jgi:hypothetical protein
LKSVEQCQVPGIFEVHPARPLRGDGLQ